MQWSHFTHFFGTDDLSFEVKLFDDGTLEFHYAAMTSGGTTNYGNGNSATVWIAKPDGQSAMPISINQPNVAPYTAWRFTPTGP